MNEGLASEVNQVHTKQKYLPKKKKQKGDKFNKYTSTQGARKPCLKCNTFHAYAKCPTFGKKI